MDKPRRFIPAPYVIWLYLLISLVLLAVGSTTAIIESLTSGLASEAEVATVFNQQISYYQRFLEQYDWLGTLSLALFWGSIGALGYSLVWLLINVVVGLRNKYVLATKYIHLPFRNHPHIFAVWSRRLLAISLVIITVFYLNLSWQFLYPLWTELFSQFIGGWSLPATWLKVVIAISGMMLTIHIGWSLIKLSLLRKQPT